MSTLRDYLGQKRDALLARRRQATSPPPHVISARVTAEGRSGLRRIRIRDVQVVSDSGPDFAGYDLGPSSPDLQRGVRGSCRTHVFLIQAADRDVPRDALEVEVSGRMDPRARRPGCERLPVSPHDIADVVPLASPASSEEIAALHAAVERACPMRNLLLNPQTIRSRIDHRRAAEPAATAV